MKIIYPALIIWNPDDKVFEVDFPDLDGCITFGSTRSEAESMAIDALSGYLQSIMSRGLEIPVPSKVKGAALIEPRASVAFALWLRTRRKISGMTLTEAAEKLGVKYQVYQRLENPETANPTLKTIKRLERVFGEELVRV